MAGAPRLGPGEAAIHCANDSVITQARRQIVDNVALWLFLAKCLFSPQWLNDGYV